MLFARRTLALFLLVEETAVVLNAADGRNRIGRDFDQVKTALTGDFQRLEWCKDSKLFAVFVDDADLAGANPVVNADKRLGRSFIESDGAPPKAVLAGLGLAARFEHCHTDAP